MTPESGKKEATSTLYKQRKKNFIDACIPVGRLAFSGQILFYLPIRLLKKNFIRKMSMVPFLFRAQKTSTK